MLHHAVNVGAAGARTAVDRRGAALQPLPHLRRRNRRAPSAPTPPPPRAEPASGGGGPAGLSEDVLARLRAAESEAARLREELAQVQAASSAAAAAPSSSSAAADSSDGAGPAAAAAAAAPVRIDSTDSRELPWTAGKRTAWLSEADVTFFTGAGATEGAQLRDGGGGGGGAAGVGGAEAEGVVRRRLLQGAAATALLAAFALVPTSALRLGAPAKPLFFYLVPLVRALDQLRDLEPAVEDADWPRLRAARALIVGPPGNARDNMFDAIAALDAYYKAQEGQGGGSSAGGGGGGAGGGGGKGAKGVARRAEQLAAEVVEALDALDYNKYFDSAMMGAVPSGSLNAEFVRFTREARKAAQKGLGEFLALMPREAVEGARQVVEQQRAAMAAAM